MAKDKKVGKSYNPSITKQPRMSIENKFSVENILEHHPVWQLKILDVDHEIWGWKNLKNQTFYDVLSKLKAYESMQWKEIKSNKNRDHSISFNDLTVKAKERLKELQLDDIDKLFRLRLTGKQRVWGILDRYIFKILWWDPEHSVCPSNKKHT